ncbi:hypothetical protein ES705_45762 [subsurface metagenome]
MSGNDKKSTKRTLRENKFIEAYISLNGNAGKAYKTMSPDVTMDSARELGKRMLKKVDLSISEILDKIGLSDPAVAQILKDGLSATRESGRGEKKKEILDHTIISKYIEMVFKLKASYPADRSKLELTGKDGQPLGPQIKCIIETQYHMCPLRLQCPIDKEVREAERLECIKNAKNKDKKKGLQLKKEGQKI